MAVDSKNNIHVVWEDHMDLNGNGVDSDIFYKMFNSTTLTWGVASVISNGSDEASYVPQILIDSNDNMMVIWDEYPSGIGTAEIVFRTYNHNTGIWSATGTVTSDIGTDVYNFEAALDSRNNIHLVVQTVVSPSSQIYYYVYNTSTKQWGTKALLSTESTTYAYAKVPSIAIDSGDNINVVWQDQTNLNGVGTDQDVFYKRFDNGTLTWNSTSVLSSYSTKSSINPNVAVDASGNVYVVWTDDTQYNSNDGIQDPDVFFKSYNATTQTWTNVTLISTETTLNAALDTPKIATDSHNNLYVTWYDKSDINGAGTDEDIFYKKFDTTTHSWQSTTVVSTESPQSSFYPFIAIDHLDNVHIVWEDVSPILNSLGDSDIFYKFIEDDTVLNSLDSPADVSYELGSTGNTIQWNAVDTNPGAYSIENNNQVVNSGSWTSNAPIITSIDNLAVGTYNFTIKVMDASGNFAVDTVWVTVSDTTAPIFSETPLDLTFQSGTIGNNVSWLGSDYSAENYIVYLDDVNWKSGMWLSGNTIDINVDVLTVGTYNVTIVIFDTYSHSISDTVIVTVQQASTTSGSPISIPSISTPTPSSSSSTTPTTPSTSIGTTKQSTNSNSKFPFSLVIVGVWVGVLRIKFFRRE